VGLLQIEREGHILICSPSARLSGLNIPIELRGSQNLVAIALQWKLPPGEVREFNWTLLPGAPSTKSFPNATTSSSIAVQRAIRVLGFPEWLHNWLQSSTKRPFCVCSEGGDGSKNKIGMSFETEALYAILRQYKSAQDVGVLSDVRTLFIHVSCLKSLHKVKGLVQRRKRNLTTMFFLYGSHPESDRSLWGMREIFPIGASSILLAYFTFLTVLCCRWYHDVRHNNVCTRPTGHTYENEPGDRASIVGDLHYTIRSCTCYKACVQRGGPSCRLRQVSSMANPIWWLSNVSRAEETMYLISSSPPFYPRRLLLCRLLQIASR